MQLLTEIARVRQFVGENRRQGKSIGFVPTMGYLHDGHLELMRQARRQCDVVIISIFVNPLQFGPAEDFSRYPRDLERDLKLAATVPVDAVFYPDASEMYPHGYSTHVDVTGLTGCLCGRSRPGHFRGVATVVTKLFNIVQPDRAYFGQKDAQQVLVIRRLVEDLNLPLEIVTVPTVREADGLAMSSRNVYLNPKERAAAPVIYQSLLAAREAVQQGEKNVARLEELVQRQISSAPGAQIDYCEIRALPNLERIQQIGGPALLAVAVRFGQTRLIDNIVLEG